MAQESPEHIFHNSVMMIAALALAATLLAPARAAEMPALQALLDSAGQQGQSLDFSRFKPEPPVINPAADHLAPLSVMGLPMTIVRLTDAFENMRRTSAVFYAGGVPVHVFGAKSQNDRSLHSWFLEFYPENPTGTIFPEGSKDTLFLNIWKILRWSIFLRGMGHAEINSRHYNIHIDGSRHEMESRLVIEPKEKGEKNTTITGEQISRASFETGYPVRIGGTEYRIIYAQDFLSKNGQFAGYSADRSIVLMFAEGQSYGAYHFYEKDLKSDQVLVTSPKKSTSSENQQTGQLTLGLRINPAGDLEIYYPVPAAAAQPSGLLTP